ncbi:O-antigen ligase family protein [Patescibacteria group bacterium]|nr:O-antigen ligase family protein [Patescibacteria group bacterium]
MLKKNSLDKIYTFLICSIVFLIPSNLFLKLNTSSAYVNGLLVDYLIPKLYLSDIFILILLLFWLIKVVLNKKKIAFKTSRFYLPSILISLIIIRQIFTPYPLAAVWYLFKLIEIGLLGWFLATHKKLFQKSTIYISIICTILFQSSLALWQFFTQKSLLGYTFLGEPNLSNSIGLAKDIWWNTGRVLPYGTTAHPNILGGVLAIFSLILIIQLLKTKQKWAQILTSLTILLTIFVITLTQSISALTSLIIGNLLILLKPYYQKIANISRKLLIGSGIIMVVTPLLINLTANSFKNNSLTRRSYLQNAAIEMFLNNPIAGVGLNQFTARVEEYSNAQEIVRFIQPAHHIGLLWLAETGVFGILLIWILGGEIKIKKIILSLIILLPIAVLDHYLLTQQSGLLLFVFVFNFF